MTVQQLIDRLMIFRPDDTVEVVVAGQRYQTIEAIQAVASDGHFTQLVLR